MATHSSTLAWEIPWTQEPDGLQSVGSQESDTTEQLNHHYHLLQADTRVHYLSSLMVPAGPLKAPADLSLVERFTT